MELSADKTIGKYDIVSVLGSGATSVVYLGYDTFTKRPVAIKIFHSEILTDPEHGQTYRKLIANEASLAGQLTHPHIVAIYDAVLSEDKNYIVMEYVDGETLEKYSQPDNLLPVEKVIEVIFKCALALDFASRNGVIHRDIKPANIMLRLDGDVKIADFGSAVLLRSEATQLVGVGSPAYMSPEQIRQDPLTLQTDIYSLGVVMFKLLTGRLPFQGESSFALANKILNEVAPSVRTLRPTLPMRVVEIVAKTLCKNKSERYTDWKDFTKDLSDIAALDIARETGSETQRFNTLRALPFFRDFSDAELWEVLRISIWGRVPAETVLIKEGDDGDFFYILTDGKVRVMKGDKQLNTKGREYCFGEMCYIRKGSFKRTATVIAARSVTLLKIRAESLRKASINCQHSFDHAFMNMLVDRLAQANADLANL